MDSNDLGLVVELRQAFGSNDFSGGAARREHRFEDALRGRAADGAVRDEAEQLRELRGPNGRPGNFPPRLLQRARQLAHHPIARGLRPGAGGDSRLEKLGNRPRLRQLQRVVFGQPMGVHEPPTPRVRQLGHRAADGVHLPGAHHERREVGLGKYR